MDLIALEVALRKKKVFCCFVCIAFKPYHNTMNTDSDCGWDWERVIVTALGTDDRPADRLYFIYYFIDKSNSAKKWNNNKSSNLASFKTPKLKRRNSCWLPHRHASRRVTTYKFQAKPKSTEKNKKIKTSPQQISANATWKTATNFAYGGAPNSIQRIETYGWWWSRSWWWRRWRWV